MIPKFDKIPESGLILAIDVGSRVNRPKLISNIMLAIATPINTSIDGMPVINNCRINLFFTIVPLKKRITSSDRYKLWYDSH